MKRVIFVCLQVLKACLWAGAFFLTIFFFIVSIATFSVIHGFGGSGQLPADCALVFGAAVYGNQFPGPAIVRRVGGAGEYYRQGLIAHTIILSGGTGTGNKLSEAQVMKREALKQGIPKENILTEEESHSTFENLAYSQPLAKDCKTVVGISDKYHLARIDLLAHRLDWQNFSTVPIQGSPTPELERRSIVREIIAYIYYALHADAFIHLYTE
jgi:uncharacterized SAM-binding protein YcdF (DUF218 family)